MMLSAMNNLRWVKEAEAMYSLSGIMTFNLAVCIEHYLTNWTIIKLQYSQTDVAN